MRNTLTRASLLTAFNLLFFAVIGTAILAFTFSQTHELIVKSEETEKLKLIMQIVPRSLFDNDIMGDTLTIAASQDLGTDHPTTVYRARLQGKPSAVVLEAIAPDGYSGKIGLIIAIREDGALSGVRVVSHKETPGLGDYIEFTKNRWISLFDGASHARYKEDDWKVRKDGGQFDYMAGATISPRAVIKAVHKALHYYETNREQLFAPLAAQTAHEGIGK
jgi:Na+-translocating ferredoxin:NAD+ oxidoreductase subunit G